MQELNVFLLQSLNNLSQGPVLSTLVPILADLPIFFLPIFLTGMWLKHSFPQNRDIKDSLLFLFYSALVAIFISLVIQKLVHLERPEQALQSASNLLLSHIPDASFPSDHASVSVAFLTGLFLAGFRKVFWAFLPWVILMNLSRVMAGVHWPFDILAGTAVGIISAFISFRILRDIKVVKSINIFIIQTLEKIKL